MKSLLNTKRFPICEFRIWQLLRKYNYMDKLHERICFVVNMFLLGLSQNHVDILKINFAVKNNVIQVSFQIFITYKKILLISQ